MIRDRAMKIQNQLKGRRKYILIHDNCIILYDDKAQPANYPHNKVDKIRPRDLIHHGIYCGGHQCQINFEWRMVAILMMYLQIKSGNIG